ncbi:MAG: hypothetical protein KGR26_04840, partial [Cyanobacteria bacterium REEB65]|nr:hypothetical protein [Cyanobacteria bacterium REEB65]
AHTHHWSATVDDSGGEVAISYSLRSGDADLGEFSLSIRMTRTAPEEVAPENPAKISLFRRPGT